MTRFLALFVVCALLFSCGSSEEGAAAGAKAGAGAPGPGVGAAGGTSDGGAAKMTGLPCDVAAIVAQHCGGCHGASPQFGAPMALASVEDFHAAARSDSSKRVYELAQRRIHDDGAAMPPPPNARLAAADLAPLDAWLGAGAPVSSATCGAAGGGGSDGGGGTTVPPMSCQPDLKLRPSTKWSMPTDTQDVYVCYGVDVPMGQKKHLIGFSPSIDNSKIVHHVALFESGTSTSPTPTPCSLTGQGLGRVLYGWAPGGGALELPAQAGLPEQGTVHLVVQVHYNNLRALVGEQDATGVDICTTSQLRPADADLMAFGTSNITIPAHGTSDVTCDFGFPQGLPLPITVFSAMPHMHKLGKTISSTLIPQVGASSSVVSVAAWDFNTQPWTKVSSTIQTGDTIRTRCAWSNTTDRTVTYGEGTADEMCGVGMMYYPRITTGGWQMNTPITAGSCHPT